MEKRNSHLEHGQPMKHRRGLFCTTCDSGVARCQSQHQYHFGVRSVSHGQLSLAIGNQMCVVMRLYLHFQSKSLINLMIFATVHSLMNGINVIDSCQAHLPVQ